MRPIALKGHERAINQLKYNREGDLIFTCAKDAKACVWYAHNGERLGTYNGHGGTIWALDVTSDSKLLLTGSADSTARIWDVQSGRSLFLFPHKVPIRSVAFAAGDQTFLTVTDQVMGEQPRIALFRVPEDRSKEDSAFLREITMPLQLPREQQTDPPAHSKGPQETPKSNKLNQALFTALNDRILTAHEDGTVRLFDTETGKLLQWAAVHSKGINFVAFAHHYGYFITASDDGSAKLIDSESLRPQRTYEAGKHPVNAAAISPLFPHVILGGGQEAMDVTTTSSRVGHFQTRFFHKVYAEEIGSVKGHFGPVHTLSFSPDGRSFASGAEDGYVRIHHFDQSYFEESTYDQHLLATAAKKKDA